MELITLLTTIIAVIALVKWLLQYISSLTLMWYLTEKGFPLPTPEELKKGSRYVVSHLLKDLCAGKS